jgi:hypothetical protein
VQIYHDLGWKFVRNVPDATTFQELQAYHQPEAEITQFTMVGKQKGDGILSKSDQLALRKFNIVTGSTLVDRVWLYKSKKNSHKHLYFVLMFENLN